ncbi:MAG: pilus assembly protein PilM [Deltaproteobacteria bacterium]|nr:pilus assembly protein PilM [Deltaproteobacteria bacterium]
MPQRFVGIDVGASSVKAVVLEDSMRGHRVVSAKEVPIAWTGPASAEETKVARENALRTLLAEPEVTSDRSVATFPGELVTIRFVTLPFSDARKVEMTLPGEVADVIPFDLDEAVLGHEVVEKKEDGASISLVTLAKKDRVSSALADALAAGLDPRCLVVDVLALFNLYSHYLENDGSKAEAPSSAAPGTDTFVLARPGGPPDARLVVDIGHTRTLVLAAGERGIAHVRVIRAGGLDVTKAIAEAFGVPIPEAEEMKRAAGFVASTRHPAPSEEDDKMSAAIAKGLRTLIGELRRTLAAIRSERRARIARIDLLGGGSRIRNLAPHLAEELNVPTAHAVAVEQLVEPFVDASRRSAFGVALGAALRLAGDAKVSGIDLRSGEFAYAGQLAQLVARLPVVMGSAAALFLLLLANVYMSYHTVSAREAEIDKAFCSVTKEVVGREVCEPKLALAAMTQPASELGNVKLPERSALNVAAELSERIPKGLDVKIEELDISPDRARVVGNTTTFDAVDQIVAEYEKDACYKEIKKGNLRKTPAGDRVEFQLTMQLECS